MEERDVVEVEGQAVGVDDPRRARLVSMLRELVWEEGRMEAAALLEVNYKTLARAMESGQLTGRMADALERLLGPGDGSGAGRQGGRVGALEQRVEALEAGLAWLAGELRAGLEGLRAVEAEVQGPESTGSGEEAGQPGDRDGPAVAGLGPGKQVLPRRKEPEVVTGEPAGDDPEVYGKAWPLVEEWRRLRAGHPHRGSSLSWLEAEELLLTRELQMLEEHGLTLPPETQPLRGFGRKGQINWRRTALADTRRALRRRRLLRWARRVGTLGQWRE